MSAKSRTVLAGVPGARVPLGPWLLQLGLAEARRVLSEKKER